MAVCSVESQGSSLGSIGGVIRLASGEAAAGAEVIIVGANSGQVWRASTDGRGGYAVRALIPDRYTIRVQGGGRGAAAPVAVDLRESESFRQDLVLGTRAQRRGDLARRQPPVAKPVRVEPAVREFRPDASETAGPRSARRQAGYFSSSGRPGANEFHGAVYHQLGNDLLNARGFFGSESPTRENRYGAFVGGPVIRNKTFFAYHYEGLVTRARARSGYAATAPTEAFRRGDFASLLTGRAIAADALGRPLMEGQVFDPASTRSVDRVPVRDAFPNNAIPLAHHLRSGVAGRVLDLVPLPDRPGLDFNVQGALEGDQTWSRSAPAHFWRIDHAFHEAFRAHLRFSRTSSESIDRCGGVGGCRVLQDPVLEPEGNLDYVGTGIFERVMTHHVRPRIDWIISPNLLYQFTAGYDELHVTGHSLAAGAGWPSRLWGPGGNGLVEVDAGPPAMQFTGNTPYSPLGSEWGRSGFRANHEYRVGSDLTWIGRRHTLRVGGEYRLHQYPLRGWATNVAGRFDFHRLHTGGFDADGNNIAATGDPMASFLLGQVNSTHFEIPDSPTMIEHFVSWSVVDEFRLSRRLTLTLGLRFDYQTAIRERRDNMSTFDPHVPNPGAGGRLGAMIFAGRGPSRTGSRTLENPPRDAFGPRVGFAYRLNDQTVMRGAYSIHYARVPYVRFAASNTIGFKSYSTAIDMSNGQRAAYFLDDGVPQDSIVMLPAIDPAIANNTSAVAVTRDRTTLPRVQDWSWSVQRQISSSASLDLSYRGNRGSRLVADRSVLGPAANANVPAVLSLGPGLLGASAGGASAAVGIARPYDSFSGSVAQALRPFPQMLDIGYLNVPAGNSFFHALEAGVAKRFWDGARFDATYTWSKLTGMGAGALTPNDGLGYGPQNPADTQSLERGLSVDDVPHRAIASFTHKVPTLGVRRLGIPMSVLGGWSMSGIVRVASGTPVNVVMANDLQPFLFNGQKRPDILSERVRLSHGRSFDAATGSVFSRSAFADPGPLQFGNASRTMGFVRSFSTVAEDIALFKEAALHPKVTLRFQTEVANVFNRTIFCAPNRNWSARSFGRVYAQCNTPRSIRFGLRLDF